MSQRRLAFPTTEQQSTRPERLTRDNFAGGMNVDDPASELQANELAKLVNLIAFDNYMEGRTGCKELLAFPLPAIQINSEDGPQDILLIGNKDDYEVEITGEWDATQQDKLLINDGDYFYWPETELLDQITDRSAPTYPKKFTSLIVGDYAQANCKVIGQPFGAYYHDKTKMLYLHLGTELWKIDNSFTEYQRVTLAGSEGLSRTRSRFRPQDANIIIFNGNGIFKINTGEPNEHYFKINVDVPIVLIDEVSATDAKLNGRQVIYTLARIVGGNFNEGRLGTDNLLLQETGPCASNAATGRDSAKVYTELPVGTGKETKDVLTSKDSAIDHCQDNYLLWQTWPDWAFKISMNSIVKNIRFDGSGVANMFEVADRIQSALRSDFPSATCEYKISALGNPTLIITPGETGVIDDLNGTTGTYVDAPDAGHDAIGSLKMGLGDGTLQAVLAKEPVSYTGLGVELDSAAMTHMALYGSKNLKNASTFSEKLIWIKDVPIIRVLSGALPAKGLDYSGQVFQTGSGMAIYKDDEGSVVRFFNGTEITLQKITQTAGGDDSYESTSLYGRGKEFLAPAGINGPAAIGAEKVARASQLNAPDFGIITIDNVKVGKVNGVDTDGIYEFEDGDVGRIIFVSDGTLRTIIHVQSKTIAWVKELDIFNDLTIAWNYNKLTAAASRAITDTVTDVILESRGGRQGVDDFLLQTRYFKPMPSGSIGEVANTFIFVAPDNSNAYYYSATPLGQKHRGGYYHPGYQKDDNAEDVITFIKRYADRIVFFCRRSTWGTSTATINSIDEPTLGEKIFIVPSVSFVANIGLVNVDSLQDIGIGQSIMITTEPAVRTFDGNTYSERNYAYKKVMKYLSCLAKIVYTSYDPIGGYVIYGTFFETEPGKNRINPDTGFCLRFAIMDSQGRGWTIYQGAEMAWPMPYTQGLLIQNEGGYLIQILLDGRTGKWYSISTYPGPDGSDLERVWTDKGETDISCLVTWNEDRGPSESFQLEFLENHIFLRPIDDAPIPTEDPAFKTRFQVYARCYRDGKIEPLGESKAIPIPGDSKAIPIPGDIVFDRKQQGPRIQLEHEFTTSRFRVLSSDRYYASRDRAGLQSLSQRTTPDSQHQQEYAQQLIWITRGNNPILNRSTGISATGGYQARISGPDGYSNSALQFDGADHLAIPVHQDLTGDFTLQFGVKE